MQHEAGPWAWRTVFLSNLAAIVISFQFRYSPELADLSWLHAANMTVQWIWMICFFGCLFMSPGLVVDALDEKGNSAYGNGLSAIAADASGDASKGIKLCHSCHIRRPLRAKHDNFLRRCVHKFDHHCPFVGNTVGRDNHRFFMGLLITHQFCYILFVVTSIYFARRAYLSWSLLIFLLYSTMWDFMMMGLGSYHMRLMVTNMTTNESMGISKYDYLLDPESGRFDNPFCRGNIADNALDMLFPYKNQFFDRDSVVRFISRRGPQVRLGGEHEGCSHDHSHGGGHSHSHGHDSHGDRAPLLRDG
jgi:hypothetical protein